MRRFAAVLGLALACGLTAQANYVVIRVVTNEQGVAQPAAQGLLGGAGSPGIGMPMFPGGMPMLPGGLPGSMPMLPGVFPGGMPPIGEAPPAKIELGPNDSVMAVIEISKLRIFKNNYDPTNPNAFASHTFRQGGYALLFQDGQQIQYGTVKLETPEQQFVKNNRTLQGAARTPDAVLRLAQWCLSAGLVDHCRDLLEELVRKSDGKDFPARPAAAVAAYRQISEGMSADVPDATSGKAWADQLFMPGREISKHYYLIHAGEGGNEFKELNDMRIALLEKQFRTFYYWFAIHGKALPLPKSKMVVVVPKNQDNNNYGQAKAALGAHDLVSDGFHARRENLLVLAPQRLDEPYRAFQSIMNESVYREFRNKEDLLGGPYPAKQIKTKAAHDAWGRAQTLALVDYALTREGLIASISHEGTLQLFAASGLVPRNVQMPEWLKFGLGALFDTPKGPFPSETSKIKVAMWSGSGGVNWAWMRHWEELKAKRKLPDRSLDLLMNTISDTYFVLASEGKEEPSEGVLKGGASLDRPKSGDLIRPFQSSSPGSQKGSSKSSAPARPGMPPGMPGMPPGLIVPPGVVPSGVPGLAPEAEKVDPLKLEADAKARARTFAWALTYYLAENDFNGLMALFAELNLAPRDVEISQGASVMLFARAFKAVNVGLGRDQPDLGKLKSMADRWVSYMDTQRSLVADFKLDDPTIDTGEEGGNGMPGMP